MSLRSYVLTPEGREEKNSKVAFRLTCATVMLKTLINTSAIICSHLQIFQSYTTKTTYGHTHVTDRHDWLTVLGVWRHFLHQADEVEQELGVVVGQFQIIAVLPEKEDEPFFRRKIDK